MSEKLLAVVVGLGEIGEPIYRMLAEASSKVRGYDINPPDAKAGIPMALDGHQTFEFMHICFPQTHNFVKNISDYISMFKPRFIIIHSTISVGMISLLQRLLGRFHDEENSPHYVNFFYSPVRGNIRDGMAWCLKTYTKYIAGSDSPLGSLHNVKEHFARAGFPVKEMSSVSGLEKAKLWDLAWYGLNIAFYQELERDCYPVEYKAVKEFIESTPVESQGKAQRILLYGGHIGGHCVMPAIEKILAVKEIPMLRAVIESNIIRKREVTFDPTCVLGKR